MKRKRRMLILVEKLLGDKHAKTAYGVIRYVPEQVVAVVDSRHKGKTVGSVLGYGGDIPVVGSIKEGLAYKPDSLLIGLAIMGGVLPKTWKKMVVEAISLKLDIINGLHTFISTDPELQSEAKRHKTELIDLRMPPPVQRCSEGRPLHNNAKVILSVGTDGSIGKMSTMLEVHKEFKKVQPSSTCIATGQTGMLIMGNGCAIDAIKSDFVGGAMEELLLKESKRYKYLFVEGQGSIIHQGFSAVTLGLMHGTLPDAMVMCHRLGYKQNELGFKIPPLDELIRLHELLVGYFKKTKIVGISMITVGYPDEKARRFMNQMEKELNLPVEDSVRYGGKKLANALLSYFKLTTAEDERNILE